MIFGNETPFHMKPIPNRGMRKREAEVIQHYPGYQHPLEPSNRNAAYIREEHRLHPTLTVGDELKQDRALQRDRFRYNVELRRERYANRERALQEARDEEHRRNCERAAQVAGTSMKNVGSDMRDVITHQCHTQEAQNRKDYDEAMGRCQYHTRQRMAEARNNSTPYNIISWEPRKEIVVPPRPQRISSQDLK